MKYNYSAIYLKNYDGDTIDFDLDLGFTLRFKMRVRLYGVDTPELRDKDLEVKAKAYEAKEFVEEMLTAATSITVETIKDKKGKYGRYIAKIKFTLPQEVDVEEHDLAEDLVSRQLATSVNY